MLYPAPFGNLITSAVETPTESAKRRSKRCVVFLCLGSSLNVILQSTGRHRGLPLSDVSSPFCHRKTTINSDQQTYQRAARWIVERESRETKACPHSSFRISEHRRLRRECEASTAQASLEWYRSTSNQQNVTHGRAQRPSPRQRIWYLQRKRYS